MKEVTPLQQNVEKIVIAAAALLLLLTLAYFYVFQPFAVELRGSEVTPIEFENQLEVSVDRLEQKLREAQVPDRRIADYAEVFTRTFNSTIRQANEALAVLMLPGLDVGQDVRDREVEFALPSPPVVRGPAGAFGLRLARPRHARGGVRRRPAGAAGTAGQPRAARFPLRECGRHVRFRAVEPAAGADGHLPRMVAGQARHRPCAPAPADMGRRCGRLERNPSDRPAADADVLRHRIQLHPRHGGGRAHRHPPAAAGHRPPRPAPHTPHRGRPSVVLPRPSGVAEHRPAAALRRDQRHARRQQQADRSDRQSHGPRRDSPTARHRAPLRG